MTDTEKGILKIIASYGTLLYEFTNSQAQMSKLLAARLPDLSPEEREELVRQSNELQARIEPFLEAVEKLKAAM